ncbi:MAG: hypothetical protein KC468_35695 [Myxococcales bacterium]|nr:hypothetical protein [Myxococcales bacterium]
MSVEQHERAAQAEQDEAKAHADQYDPSLEGTEELCPGGLICWTTWSNPTAEHNQEANRHRQLAKKHREAAEALRTAEAQACVGVDERDRDLSPFFHAPDIQRVTVPTPESQNPVEVVFRPVQGLTEAGLQKLVDCHIARSAATGHEMPDMDYCPLVPRGVQAAVSTRDGAFVVTISVENNERDARAEVLKRATALEQRTKAG